jgi:hypothetical protein
MLRLMTQDCDPKHEASQFPNPQFQAAATMCPQSKA